MVDLWPDEIETALAAGCTPHEIILRVVQMNEYVKRFPVVNYGSRRDLRIFERLAKTADCHSPRQRKRYMKYFKRVHG